MENVLWIYGVLEPDGEGGVSDSVTPLGVRDQLAKFDRSQPIMARVNSPGGSVFAATAIRTLLSQWPAGVDATVDGLAASAASFLITIARTVAMAPGSMQMIHSAWTITVGDSDDHAAAADVLETLSENIVQAYVKKSGQSAATIRAAMKKESWYTAEGAVQFGLADGLLDDQGRLILGARSQRSLPILQRQLDALVASIK